MREQKPERFTALRAEARRRIEARRRTIEELARMSMGGETDQHGGSDIPESACEPILDPEFEQRVFDDIIQFLDQEDEYRTVTIEDLMKLGTPHD